MKHWHAIHRVRIERRSGDQGDDGDPLPDWTDGVYAERAASLEVLTSSELLAAQGRQATVTRKFKLRWLDGVKPDMRLIWNTLPAAIVHDIKAAFSQTGLKDYLFVIADEIAGAVP